MTGVGDGWLTTPVVALVCLWSPRPDFSPSGCSESDRRVDDSVIQRLKRHKETRCLFFSWPLFSHRATIEVSSSDTWGSTLAVPTHSKDPVMQYFGLNTIERTWGWFYRREPPLLGTSSSSRRPSHPFQGWLPSRAQCLDSTPCDSIVDSSLFSCRRHRSTRLSTSKWKGHWGHEGETGVGNALCPTRVYSFSVFLFFLSYGR